MAVIYAVAAFAFACAGNAFAVPPIFGDPQFAVGLEPRDVEIADLDGDGIADAVVPNFFDQTVSVMLGTGGGGFVEHAVLEVDGGPQAVAIADFDDDDNADLAVAQHGVNQVTVFRGDGSGNFTLHANISVSGMAQDVVAANLAGDPLPDLAVAITGGTEGVTVLVNNGAGVFTEDGVVFDGSNRLGLAAGDLDGDGDTDLVAGTIFQVAVFLNTPSGLGASSNLMVGGTAFRLALGDLDGDGDLDLAATAFGAPEVTIARNRGDGRFAPVHSESLGTGEVTSVDIADLNGDGNGEILATVNRTGPGLLAILSSDPSTGFTLSTQEVATVPVALKAGFIDSDARVDAVIVGGSFALDAPLPGKMTVLRNRGFGGLGGYRVYETAPDAEPEAVIAADFDGNGSLDLAVANFPGTSVSILLNNGFGRFSAAAPVTDQIDRPYSLAADDLDGDGDTDLVVGNNVGFLNLYRNLGGGSFAPAEFLETAGRSPQIAIADMNGDTEKDIVLAHTVASEVLVLFNDGTGAFSAQPATAVSARFNISMVLADVDGMNGPDAVVAGRDGDLSVLLNDGSGNLGTPTVYPIGMGSDLLAVASDDVDGDGDPDVAVADHGNEVVHLYQNVGGTLNPLSMLPAGEELASVLLADMNNDGDADLVTSNKVAGTLP
ncbi:MAG: FG-GAP-like repeat-containing protein, partial [Candidatus Deferrimicrobiaceae bacterium]